MTGLLQRILKYKNKQPDEEVQEVKSERVPG